MPAILPNPKLDLTGADYQRRRYSSAGSAASDTTKSNVFIFSVSLQRKKQLP
jgi:hypothetical protein